MRKLKLMIYYVTVLAVLYAIIIALVYLFQTHLIFFPTKIPKEEPYSFETQFQEINLNHINGEKINGLYFKCEEEAKGLVLYFHGNAASLVQWGSLSNIFTDRAYDVFMIDYRGFGKSDGKANEKNLFEDGLLAYEWATNNFPANRIIVYGRSFGASVASHVSSLNTPGLLILESPLSSIEDVVHYHYPYLLFPFTPKNNFSAFNLLEDVNCPIHIIHGTNDEIIPLKSMEKLKNFLSDEDSFFIVTGGGHNNLNSFASFHKELDRLLK